MPDLAHQRCTPCHGGEPGLTETEVAAFLPQVPGWRVVIRGGEHRLERVFTFKNFDQALAFTDRVGALAAAADHHPALLTEWGRVTVTWWTHKIGGLHRNDFIMAAQTDAAYAGML